MCKYRNKERTYFWLEGWGKGGGVGGKRAYNCCSFPFLWLNVVTNLLVASASSATDFIYLVLYFDG